jgi:hypothetical protein
MDRMDRIKEGKGKKEKGKSEPEIAFDLFFTFALCLFPFALILFILSIHVNFFP